MTTTLTNALEGAKVKVKKIGENPEIRYELRELGIKQGDVLKILEDHHKRCFYSGLYRIKVNGKVGVLSQHLAQKVLVMKNSEVVHLADLCQGEKSKVFAYHGELEERVLLREMGIKSGVFIEIIGHFPDDLLVFDVEGEEEKLSSGLATKIWVILRGKKIQINYLPQGVLSKIVNIVSCGRALQAFTDMGFIVGQFVKLKRHEEIPFDEGVDKHALFVEKNGSSIRLGLDLANQVWVEEVLN